MPLPPQTLLDACAVVNLYATRHMEEILASIEGQVAVADLVEQEAQYVFHGGTGDDARERESINLNPLVASGALLIISTTIEDELLTFLDLTQEVDQGEAITAALAIHRGYTVVTDDRKATRVITGRGVITRTTLDLIKEWAEQRSISQLAVRTALADLRQRGRYEPATMHPLRDWWDRMMQLG